MLSEKRPTQPFVESPPRTPLTPLNGFSAFPADRRALPRGDSGHGDCPDGVDATVLGSEIASLAMAKCRASGAAALDLTCSHRNTACPSAARDKGRPGKVWNCCSRLRPSLRKREQCASRENLRERARTV
jgi:hypothetical protein